MQLRNAPQVDRGAPALRRPVQRLSAPLQCAAATGPRRAGPPSGGPSYRDRREDAPNRPQPRSSTAVNDVCSSFAGSTRHLSPARACITARAALTLASAHHLQALGPSFRRPVSWEARPAAAGVRRQRRRGGKLRQGLGECRRGRPLGGPEQPVARAAAHAKLCTQARGPRRPARARGQSPSMVSPGKRGCRCLFSTVVGPKESPTTTANRRGRAATRPDEHSLP